MTELTSLRSFNTKKAESSSPSDLEFFQEVYLFYLNTGMQTQEGKTIRRASKQVQDAYRLLGSSGNLQEFSSKLQDAINNDQRVWVISDPHFGHQNILEYANRPFFNEQQMHDHLNMGLEKINDDEILLCLGDFAMGLPEKAIDKFNSLRANKFIIAGNHDLKPSSKIKGYKAHKQSVATLKVNSIWLWLSHYPIEERFLPNGVVNLHGHTHNSWIEGGRHICACVEHWNYEPWDLKAMITYWQTHGQGVSTQKKVSMKHVPQTD